MILLHPLTFAGLEPKHVFRLRLVRREVDRRFRLPPDVEVGGRRNVGVTEKSARGLNTVPLVDQGASLLA